MKIDEQTLMDYIDSISIQGHESYKLNKIENIEIINNSIFFTSNYDMYGSTWITYKNMVGKKQYFDFVIFLRNKKIEKILNKTRNGIK